MVNDGLETGLSKLFLKMKKICDKCVCVFTLERENDALVDSKMTEFKVQITIKACLLRLYVGENDK